MQTHEPILTEPQPMPQPAQARVSRRRPRAPKPLARNYCLFMDGGKHNRNVACHAHDQAYGVYGGGTERDRWRADIALFRHMRAHNDPLAWLALYFTLVYGWFFFNYHRRPWKGQLIKRFNKRYREE